MDVFKEAGPLQVSNTDAQELKTRTIMEAIVLDKLAGPDLLISHSEALPYLKIPVADLTYPSPFFFGV